MEYKLKEIFEFEDSAKLVLPDFQRNFEWKIDSQKQFIAAFLAQIPIGSLLILKGDRDDFAARKLCFSNTRVRPKEECLYLLDGQQRLSCLKSALYDYFKEKDKWLEQLENIDPKLSYRWFVRVTPESDEDEDVFGWTELNPPKNLLKYEPSQLVDYIEVKRIFKTKSKDWFHPLYSGSESGEALGENELKYKVASEAAKEGLVPLYSVYLASAEDIPLHVYALDKIADDRVSELRALAQDGKIDPVAILKRVEPEIQRYIKEKNEDRIYSAWIKLRTNWSQSIASYLVGLLTMDIPVIELPANEISRAVSIFESLNRGGTPLNTYDLVVARAARERGNESLSSRILEILKKPIAVPVELVERISNCAKPNSFNATFMDIVDGVTILDVYKDQYLNLLSVFSYSEYGDVEQIVIDHIKKYHILSLTHEQINQNTAIAVQALLRASAFLHFRCGIVKQSDLPYALMILPIAYALRDDVVWQDASALDKIEYWYWASLFGGYYRERQGITCVDDIKKLYRYIKNDDKELDGRAERVLKIQFYSDQDVLLRMDPEQPIPTAISKGLLQYILSKQPMDFYSNDVHLSSWGVAQLKVDAQDHHILPLSSATRLQQSSAELRKDKKHILNSPLNRTYITSKANNKISAKTPAEYFQFLDEFAYWDHFIPKNDFPRRDSDDNDEKYYRRILTARYDEFYKGLQQELKQLKNS